MNPTKEQVINKFLDSLKNDKWYHVDYFTNKQIAEVDKQHGINNFNIDGKLYNPFYIKSSKYRIQISCSYWGLDIYRIDYDKWIDRDKWSMSTQSYNLSSNGHKVNYIGFKVNLTRDKAYDIWRKICHRFDWTLGRK